MVRYYSCLCERRINNQISMFDCTLFSLNTTRIYHQLISYLRWSEALLVRCVCGALLLHFQSGPGGSLPLGYPGRHHLLIPDAMVCLAVPGMPHSWNRWRRFDLHIFLGFTPFWFFVFGFVYSILGVFLFFIPSTAFLISQSFLRFDPFKFLSGQLLHFFDGTLLRWQNRHLLDLQSTDFIF
jgi:hypothetical protein